MPFQKAPATIQKLDQLANNQSKPRSSYLPSTEGTTLSYPATANAGGGRAMAARRRASTFSHDELQLPPSVVKSFINDP